MAKFSASNAGGGALSGAASGAAIGSVIPGIGTAIGAGVGGLLGGITGGFGSGSKRISTMDKRQKALYKQYAAGLQGQGPFADMFNFNADAARENFNQSYAQPAYQQFQEEIAPTITGSFRGRNLGQSSYAGSALAKAGTDVQKNLNANLANMLYQGQQGAMDRRLQALQAILNTQTFAQQQQQPNSFESLFGGLSQGAGQYLGNQFANKYLAPQAQQSQYSPAVGAANSAFFTGSMR